MKLHRMALAAAALAHVAACAASPANPSPKPEIAMSSELSKLAATEWTGKGELWLDPAGDQAHRYECTLRIETGAVRYTWQHEGKEHKGEILIREGGGAQWTDTWHQAQPVEVHPIAGAWGLFAGHYTYRAGSEEWGWRMGLYRRPTGELVLQMTNITSWGEEARAVRMIVSKAR